MHEFLAGQGYPSEVIIEKFVTPLDWQTQGMAAGTPFTLAHTFGQTGPFRPSNVEPRLPGMFFAGSGTVPGVGVPMVLISGKLAASRYLCPVPAVLYAQILDEIERNGYDVFSQRARVPTPRKAATAARIMVTGPRTLKRQAELYQRRSTTDVTQDT
jgi:hypothetical protein